jgi:hypothetical protein
MSVLLVASWLAVPGLALAEEEELTPQKMAEIHHDNQAARAKVDKSYGNRKPSEMTNEERAQATKDQQEASRSVLEKHGVSDKDYSRREATLSPDERSAMKQAEKKIEADEKAAKEAKEEEARKKATDDEAKDPSDIPVQRGFNDENPVVLEGDESVVDVEQGLPADEAGAEGADGTTAEPTPAKAPAKGHGKRGSRHR